MKKIAMQPNNNQILDTTNKASESILRTTVPELLEDAIALAKVGATPDQLEAFMMGVITAIDAAKTLSMSHAGEGRCSIRGAGLVALGAARLGSQINSEDITEEYERATEEMAESYNEAATEWELERTELIGTIEELQAKLAQALAPKNGHRTLVEEDEGEEDGYGEEELVSAPQKSRRGTSSRERVREMLSSRRRGGQGFGRRVR